MSRAAAWLGLAATPMFAAMAMLTAAVGPAQMLCGPGQASPLTGMTAMYLLMAAVHVSPWLRRIDGHRAHQPRGR